MGLFTSEECLVLRWWPKCFLVGTIIIRFFIPILPMHILITTLLTYLSEIWIYLAKPHYYRHRPSLVNSTGKFIIRQVSALSQQTDTGNTTVQIHWILAKMVNSPSLDFISHFLLTGISLKALRLTHPTVWIISENFSCFLITFIKSHQEFTFTNTSRKSSLGPYSKTGLLSFHKQRITELRSSSSPNSFSTEPHHPIALTTKQGRKSQVIRKSWKHLYKF